jgi:hypothetical protein
MIEGIKQVRSIQVSTEVYAGIWGAHQSGEENEDAILRRLLGIAAPERASEPMGAPEGSIGFMDNRYGVVFPPGFEIFRIYKGRNYTAQAVGGVWIANDGKGYLSLNQLSDSIGASENAWDSWFYMDDGLRKPISTMRDPNKVRRRSVPMLIVSDQSAEELGL